MDYSKLQSIADYKNWLPTTNCLANVDTKMRNMIKVEMSVFQHYVPSGQSLSAALYQSWWDESNKKKFGHKYSIPKWKKRNNTYHLYFKNQ